MSEQERVKLEKKHQSELKELRSKIEQILKNAGSTKAERKVKIAETKAMEEEMLARHVEEIAALFTHNEVDIDYEEIANLSSAVSISEPSTSSSSSHPQGENAYKNQVKQPSKAAKRRDAKSKAERERREKIAEAEKGFVNIGEKESETINKKLSSLGLESVDVRQELQMISDGNCMYHAIGHQLKSRGKGSFDATTLRIIASDYMIGNPQVFIPFTADIDGDFVSYCKKVATQQSLWGGQMEALALSLALHVPIDIISAEQPTIQLGKQFLDDESPIVLTFHRYVFALGEHYNSVQSISIKL